MITIRATEVTHQYQLITEAKIKGQSTVELPLLSTPRTLYNAYHTTANLGEGSEYWFNQWMAAYFWNGQDYRYSPRKRKQPPGVRPTPMAVYFVHCPT